MYNITSDDVLKVYEQLKKQYTLVLTTTSALDEGFTVDCPIIIGKAHRQIIELYENDGIFILNVMDTEKTMGTYRHPCDVEEAIRDFTEFMNGKSDYKLNKF